MVLEPWITPSLFYQFLGKGVGEIAMDTYTFCEVLGPEEANRQLRRHWETWVTEEIIIKLAKSSINSLRLPVGDYMYKPYGPYVGCFDGALDYVDNVLDWAYSNGLGVLIDIHALKDSQNGFDNSGQSMGFKWTTAIKNEFTTDITFEHWPIRDAKWVGTFDQETATYSSINYDNIQHALDVIQIIVDTYKVHPAVHGTLNIKIHMYIIYILYYHFLALSKSYFSYLGLEPVNEPWQYTPIDVLKKFYWEGYLIVKRSAPYWKYSCMTVFALTLKFGVDSWMGKDQRKPPTVRSNHFCTTTPTYPLCLIVL